MNHRRSSMLAKRRRKKRVPGHAEAELHARLFVMMDTFRWERMAISERRQQLISMGVRFGIDEYLIGIP